MARGRAQTILYTARNRYGDFRSALSDRLAPIWACWRDRLHNRSPGLYKVIVIAARYALTAVAIGAFAGAGLWVNSIGREAFGGDAGAEVWGHPRAGTSAGVEAWAETAVETGVGGNGGAVSKVAHALAEPVAGAAIPRTWGGDMEPQRPTPAGLAGAGTGGDAGGRWDEPRAAGDDGAVPSIAIIIDDAGFGTRTLRAMMDLEYPLAFSVLPDVARAREDVNYLVERGKEILLHIPMEPVSGFKSPGLIGPSLTDEAILRLINAYLETVPEAAGANNHMGSLATADERVMRLVLGVLKEKNLFFVDSRTTSSSVGWKVAKEYGMAWAENYCFLDSVRDVPWIKSRLALAATRAAKLARSRAAHDPALGDSGTEAPSPSGVVVIGHPRPETLQALVEMIPEIEKSGVKVVPVKDVLNRPEPPEPSHDQSRETG